MSEQDYIRADREVLDIFRQPHGQGGQLPCVAVRVLPADRAERITALDQRIQAMKAAAPAIDCGLVCAAVITFAALGWMAPGLAALTVAACLIQTVKTRKEG